MIQQFFIDKIPNNREAFLKAVNDTSKRLGIDPNWLLFVMFKESNLKPGAVNSINGASGLIQFTRTTAKGLGTSVESLRYMTNVQQMEWVEKYYRPWKSRLNSFIDLYLATFFPAALGRPDDWVIQTSSLSAGYIASQNKGVDLNKDNKITVGEFKSWALKGLPQAVIDSLQKKNKPTSEPKPNANVAKSNAIVRTVCPACGHHFINH